MDQHPEYGNNNDVLDYEEIVAFYADTDWHPVGYVPATEADGEIVVFVGERHEIDHYTQGRY